MFEKFSIYGDDMDYKNIIFPEEGLEKRSLKFTEIGHILSQESNIESKYVMANSLNFAYYSNSKYIYTVQVGNYNNYQLAKKRRKYLSTLGFLCRIDEIYKGSLKSYSVRIGNFKDKELALKEQSRLKSRIGIYVGIR